jgi:hypothetical protein
VRGIGGKMPAEFVFKASNGASLRIPVQTGHRLHGKASCPKLEIASYNIPSIILHTDGQLVWMLAR